MLAYGQAVQAGSCTQTVELSNPWDSKSEDWWQAGCNSEHANNSNQDAYNPRANYAKYYTFTLEREADVILSAKPSWRQYYTRNFLIEGANRYGRVHTTFYADPLKTRLSAGTYTLETTHPNASSFQYLLAFNDVGSQECTQSIVAGAVHKDGWVPECTSTNRNITDPYNTIPDEGHRTKYLTFTLDQGADIKVDIDASVDSYVYVLSGTGEFATPFEEYSSSTFSTYLAAGDYTLEVTTRARYAPGHFTALLTTFVNDNDCQQPLELGNTVAGSWSANCEIESWINANGDPYAGESPQRAKYYQFTLDEPTDLKFSKSGSNNRSMLLNLYAQGDFFTKLASTEPTWWWRDTENEMSVRLDAGTYNLEVTAYREVPVGDFQFTSTVYENSGCDSQIDIGERKSVLLSDACESTHRVIDGIDDPYGVRPGTYYAKRFEFTLDEAHFLEMSAYAEYAGYLYLSKKVNDEWVQLTETYPENHWSSTRSPRLKRELEAGTYQLEATTHNPEQTGPMSVSVKAAFGNVCDSYITLNARRDGQLSNNDCRSAFKDSLYNHDPYGPNNGYQHFYAQRYTFYIEHIGEYQFITKSGDVETHLFLTQGGDSQSEALYGQPTFSDDNQFTYQLLPGFYTLEVTSRTVSDFGDFNVVVWDGVSEILEGDVANGCVRNIEIGSEIWDESDRWTEACLKSKWHSDLAKSYLFTLSGQANVEFTLSATVTAFLQVEKWNGMVWDTVSATSSQSQFEEQSQQYALEAGDYRLRVITRSFNQGKNFQVNAQIFIDSDGDGVADSEDAFPSNPTEVADYDLDGIGNNADMDDDNDGILDSRDALPFDGQYYLDSDGDGVADELDASPYPNFGDVRFTVEEVTVNEADGVARVVIERAMNAESLLRNVQIEVDYLTYDGSAIAGKDYEPVVGTLTFSSTVAEQLEINIPLIDNDNYEGAKDLSLRLVPQGSKFSLSKGFELPITILDNDPVPAGGVIAFSQADYTVDESAQVLNVTLSRSGDELAEAVVHFESQDGSAKAATDYIANSGTLLFAQGQREQSFSIDLIDDADQESSEFFMLQLTAMTDNIRVSDAASVHVHSDDMVELLPEIRFLESQMTIVEGKQTIRIGLERLHNLDQSLSIDGVIDPEHLHFFGSLEQEALKQKSAEFAKGQRYAFVELSVTELYWLMNVVSRVPITLTTSNPSVVLPQQPFTLNIVTSAKHWGDAFIFSGPAFEVNEGEQISIAINRLFDRSRAQTVTLHELGVSVGLNSDYQFDAQSIEFKAGESTRYVTLSAVEDQFYEGPEHSYLALSSHILNQLAPHTAVITVKDADTQPQQGVFRFSGPTMTVREDAGFVEVVVQRLYATDGAQAVSYEFIDGTAINGEHYYGQNGTVIFADGENTQTLRVPIVNTTASSDAYGFTIRLSTHDTVITSPSSIEIQILNVKKAGSSDDNDGGLIPGIGLLPVGTLMFLVVLLLPASRRRA